MRVFRRTPFALASMFAAVILTAPAGAQSWPTHPVKFIVTLGPGSGVDIESRLFADRLSQRWGQPVVLENRPGGDGVVAIGAFVKAHDDHVLLASPTSSFTAHPFLYDNLPYKPRDLQPIARLSNTVVAISVPSALNISSLKALFDLARKEPGKLNWAGVTGALDFLLEGFFKGEGLDLKKVPYRNPVEATNDLSENRVQVYEGAFAIVRPHLQSGKIKVLAVTSAQRAPTAPDIPTAKEAGYPALTFESIGGIFGPRGMPDAVRESIAADVRAVSADPVIAKRLGDIGTIMDIRGPAEFGKAVDEQRTRLADLAKVLGLKAAGQ